MKKVIRLTESDLRNIIKTAIKEQTEMGEGGKGSGRKVGSIGRGGGRNPGEHKWTEDDQILTLYNSLYDIETLGISKESVALDIIDTTVVSFDMQTANFSYLDSRSGLDRDAKIQKFVFDKYGKYDKNQLKRICFEIIERKKSESLGAVAKNRMAREVGVNRDIVHTDREKALLKLGKNPNNFKFAGTRPKFTPDNDELSEPEEQEPKRRLTSKDEIRNYLESLYKKVADSNPELAGNIQFISDYIDSELVDKETLSEIRKLFKVTINENKTNKTKKIIRITETDLRNIIKKSIKEQNKRK